MSDTRPCEDCGGAGCPYCGGPDADYHTMCFDCSTCAGTGTVPVDASPAAP